MILYPSFKPIKRTADNLIGFVSFKWDKEFQFTNLGVYEIKPPKGNIRIRLRYSNRGRPTNEVYSEILEEVNSYICAQYPESLK